MLYKQRSRFHCVHKQWIVIFNRSFLDIYYETCIWHLNLVFILARDVSTNMPLGCPCIFLSFSFCFKSGKLSEKHDLGSELVFQYFTFLSPSICESVICSFCLFLIYCFPGIAFHTLMLLFLYIALVF